MVFLEPRTPERDRTLIPEISLVQGVPWGVWQLWLSQLGSSDLLSYYPWELWLGAKWGMGARLHAREWGQGLAKHHL